MGVGPGWTGRDASTKIEHATGRARLRRITGTNTPALLWATRTSGSAGSDPASPSPTAAVTRGQNGGPPSPTLSSDGTTAVWPVPASRSATADQVAGPTDGLCTSTNSMPSLFHRGRPLTAVQPPANTITGPGPLPAWAEKPEPATVIR